MKFSSKIILLSTTLVFPLTLHSTDIYTSSHGEVKVLANLNPNIIPGDPKLGNTVLVLSAPNELENIHIVTKCEHMESILYKAPRGEKKTVYIIQVRFPSSCDMTDISIGDQENIFTDTAFSLPIKPFWKIENNLINTDSSHLLGIMRKQGALVPKKKESDIVEKLIRLQLLYKNLNTTLESDIAQNILHDRENTKYISPVTGYTLPSKDKLIPGAGRPYRRDTTDGIHHGWDIMAPMGTPVQSLSKGKIIRIVNDWNWGKFYALKKWSLTRDDELQNLDIYRGNQVWLQTMDGNVTFYSHLSRISPNITVGSYVEAGIYLGNIGISGVPDKNYKNIHLHFEIQENPFHENGEVPTPLDIMRWDYVGENMKRSDIYAKMREIFG